jgi:hypothetical protein
MLLCYYLNSIASCEDRGSQWNQADPSSVLGLHAAQHNWKACRSTMVWAYEGSSYTVSSIMLKIVISTSCSLVNIL